MSVGVVKTHVQSSRHTARAPRQELHGTPASPGVVAGPARMVRGVEDMAALQPGEIAICEFASPIWMPLLAKAAGIVSESGGSLASLAVAARERGVPAVVGIRDATRLIEDGQMLVMDGGSGSVDLQQ